MIVTIAWEPTQLQETERNKRAQGHFLFFLLRFILEKFSSKS